jgi:CRISPR-associated protein Csc2
MTVIERLKPYLGSLDHLFDESSDGKTPYIHPALRNLGSVSLVLLREIVAPTVFRNQEAEITDIIYRDKKHVRAVPNKFKFKERANGLRLLRHYGAGGAYPQNRHAMNEKDKPSSTFDLNSLVFGDSVNQGSKVLPVKAAELYSDGLSLRSYECCVEKTFHNRAFEDGSLFNPVSKENSNNLFERHFVRPGVLLVQVVSTHGRALPVEALEHLILCLGAGGAYGGQTSVTGVNVRTHVAGIYASLVERPETSPYEIARIEGVETDSVAEAAAAIHGFLAPLHETAISSDEAEVWRAGLTRELLQDSPRLRKAYGEAHQAVGKLFDCWFVKAS